MCLHIVGKRLLASFLADVELTKLPKFHSYVIAMLSFVPCRQNAKSCRVFCFIFFRNVVYNISLNTLEEQSVSIMSLVECCLSDVSLAQVT